ncbi:hypothetical protein TNCV_4068591 [Trichonephila clavipes]|nr:hypothetical protein TNCV_4068591 [Trichonephila clavipes]
MNDLRALKTTRELLAVLPQQCSRNPLTEIIGILQWSVDPKTRESEGRGRLSLKEIMIRSNDQKSQCSAKGARRSSAPRAQNELKPAMKDHDNFNDQTLFSVAFFEKLGISENMPTCNNRRSLGLPPYTIITH